MGIPYWMQDNRAFTADSVDIPGLTPHRDANGGKKPGFHRNLLVIIPERNSCFLKILKNAQSALGRCISDKYPEAYAIEKNDTRDYPNEITVLWRSPRQRTESLFRMARLKSMAAVRNGRIPSPMGGFENFVLALLNNPLLNDHAMQQVEAAKNEDGTYLPTVDFFFDQMDSLMDHYGLSMVERSKQNRTDDGIELPWTPRMEELHRSVYLDDWVKWESRDHL